MHGDLIALGDLNDKEFKVPLSARGSRVPLSARGVTGEKKTLGYDPDRTSG